MAVPRASRPAAGIIVCALVGCATGADSVSPPDLDGSMDATRESQAPGRDGGAETNVNDATTGGETSVPGDDAADEGSATGDDATGVTDATDIADATGIADSGTSSDSGTSEEAGSPETIQCESYSSGSGIQTGPGGTGEVIGYTNPGNWACYSNLTLSNQATFLLNLASGNAGAQVQVRLDSQIGTVIGTLTIAATGNGGSGFQNETTTLSSYSGTHTTLCLTFAQGSGQNTGVGNLDYFELY